MITITGDLIEIQGDLREEFDVDGPSYVATDHALLYVEYDHEGIWRITLLAGQATIVKAEDRPGWAGTAGDIYSDEATLSARWAVCGGSAVRGRVVDSQACLR